MGGGDLNLKKSWHPQTMKNIERVWKAEQKYEAERKKIEELQKELKEERAREEMTRYAEESGTIKKKDDRLDWMYQGAAGQVSRDEYLMGRPIDKQITDQYEEPESGPSAETGLLPGSIFNPATAASSLDMAAKIREDPLFEIRKREEAKKREVLTNPVKMKKIKEMLRQNLEKKEKKKKRKKEKKERRKEKKQRRSSASSSDEDTERKRKRRLVGGSDISTLRFLSSSSSSSLPRDPSPDSRLRPHLLPGYGLQLSAGTTHRGRTRTRSPHREPHNGHAHYPSSNRGDKKAEAHAGSPQRERYDRQRNHVSKKLSPEELEQRRLQMMAGAKQREEEREKNVRRYQRQDEQDKLKEQNAKRERHAAFIHDMKLQSAASSSLEDRVKRNIHSIQRTPASLDNFMRR